MVGKNNLKVNKNISKDSRSPYINGANEKYKISSIIVK